MGSLDTGSISNATWYHVFLIGGTGQTVDVLTSLSPTAPTLPSGYTVFRRIGSMLTDSSAHWTLFTQLGNEFLWATPVSNASNLTPGTTNAITVGLTVPTGIQVKANFSYLVEEGASAGNQFAYVSSFDQADVVPSLSAFSFFTFNAGQQSSGMLGIRTNTSAQFRARFTATDMSYSFVTNGWTDNRGQG